MFFEPEEAPQPWQTPWLSLRGWTPSFVGEEEAVATMVVGMSLCWRHARAGSGQLGEIRKGEEEDAVLRRWQSCHVVGRRRTTRQGEWRWRGQHEASWRRTTQREREGGQREASRRRTTIQHNKRVGVHDVVGGGGDDGRGDSGGSSWASEVGRAPPLIPGTAGPATVPAPGGVNDANDVPMAIGGRWRQGGGVDNGDGGAAANRAGRQATTGRPLPRR